MPDHADLVRAPAPAKQGDPAPGAADAVRHEALERRLQADLRHGRTLNNRAPARQLKPADRPSSSVAGKQAPPAAKSRKGLPKRLKAGAEALSGLALDDVEVHYNSAKPAALNALAYTQGSDIHVAPGQEHHLPHELWHAVQQKQGRVKPTLQRKGIGINDDEGLEREADAMGARAAAMVPDLGGRSAGQGRVAGRVVQRVVIPVGMLADNNIATSHQTVNNVAEEAHAIGGTNYSVHFHANNYVANVRNLTSVTATFDDQAGHVYHVTCAVQGGAWRITLSQGPAAHRAAMEAVLMGKMDGLRDMNGNQF
jgi:hypothetical protein